jgi:hypothetical protein
MRRCYTFDQSSLSLSEIIPSGDSPILVPLNTALAVLRDPDRLYSHTWSEYIDRGAKIGKGGLGVCGCIDGADCYD